MPTKNQAKNAIDNAVVAAKLDIDNILPIGVNIIDGSIHFNPNRFNYLLLAPDEATLNSWADTIITNLTNAGRNPQNPLGGGRRNDDIGLKRSVTIESTLASYRITL